MPIAGLPPPPSQPAPEGTQWTLYRNLLLHQAIGPSNIDTTVPNRETTYSVGNNGPIPPIPEAQDYALARLYFAAFTLYTSTSTTPPVATGEIMAVDWPVWPGANSPAAFGHAKIDGGDFVVSVDTRVGATFTWPLVWTFTWTCTVVGAPGITYSADLSQVRGDIWVALPASSRLPRLNPTNPSLDPEQAGLELTWSRRMERVPRAPHALGEVGEFVWPPMWDGTKRFRLDGVHLQVDALIPSGYTVQGDWYFTRIPGDPDTTIGPPPSETGVVHAARTDTDSTNDPLALTS